MSAARLITDGYVVDTTPKALPDGRLFALAVVTRQADQKVDEIWPDFEPFATEAEALSGGHPAAVAWVAHQASVQ